MTLGNDDCMYPASRSEDMVNDHKCEHRVSMIKTFLPKHSINFRPVKVPLYLATQATAAQPGGYNSSKIRMSSSESSKTHFTGDANAPGEQFEARQTSSSEDYTPDPKQSLKLSPVRQRLVDDIIALYSESHYLSSNNDSRKI